MKILNTLKTGSRVICTPKPEGSDEDTLVLIEGDLETAEVLLTMQGLGFSYEGNRHYTSKGEQKPFQSWRNGTANWVLTNSPAYFELFSLATALAKRLNLLDKQDRIAVFAAILYGEEHNIHTIVTEFDTEEEGN